MIGRGRLPAVCLADTMKRDTYRRFLCDPEQDLRREELRTFIGPHSEVFLATYERVREAECAPAGGRRITRILSVVISFTTAAFFLGPFWFFYRKMWMWGASLLAAMVVVSLVPVMSRTSLVMGLVAAFFGRYLYLRHAIAKIEQLRGQMAATLLQQTGGVSRVAGWVAGVVLVLSIAVALVVAHRGVNVALH